MSESDREPVLSFAQNREDVLLWRALHDVDPGTVCWVDVGAAHPVENSVTKWFALRGWRGVNIDPILASYDALVADRHDDINVHAAVGPTTGTATIWAVSDNVELSTFDATLAEALRSAGHRVDALAVDVLTLVDVFDRHVRLDCAFLKIDVEGYELEVIDGGDWERHRPWIVVIECTRTSAAHERLLTLGYGFVLDDGLNHVFVAEEQLSRFGPRLQRPVSSLDEHVLHRYSLGADERRARVLHWAAEHVATRLRGDAGDHPVFRALASLFVARVDLQRAFAGDGNVNVDALLHWATTTPTDVDPEVRIFAEHADVLQNARR